MAVIEDILNLERIEDDIYRGPIIETQMQRTFGGQVAAQCLVAATRTVSPNQAVHSLHGYFIYPGDPTNHVVFLVDRLRDGRSFSTRQVRAVQHGQTIFSMSASFHRKGEVGIDHQDRMPNVPSPEELYVEAPALTGMSNRFLIEWSQWDIRRVPQDSFEHIPGLATQQKVWFRCTTPLPDDETFHICTLAYMSDMTLLSSAKVIHADTRTQDASLDHAMWFLRPFRADEWLLYDQTSPSAAEGRALTRGKIYDREGQLVAATTQEGLSRVLRPGAESYPGERSFEVKPS